MVKALTQSSIQLKSQKEQAEQTLKQLMQTQSRLVHAEKMSGLGQLVAGIAHEINNPVSFIYGNTGYALEYSRSLIQLLRLYQEFFPAAIPEIEKYSEDIELDFLIEDFPKIIDSMRMGASRIQELVVSMRNFSRLDEVDLKQTDLHEGLESTLTILRHRLKATGNQPEILVVKKYGLLPLVDCAAGQLNQVFMNLLSNSIDALRDDERNPQAGWQPQIQIITEVLNAEQVSITIGDNGVGISEKILSKIFEPFFTTKPTGQGTGLGLSISYQIVTEFHNGQLQCDSVRGRGTWFKIVLPIRNIKAGMSDAARDASRKLTATA
ncbi:MAG: hypothetical protein HC838_10690 [Spirulinaceae cyanobacterium RM2_2_10]|nr:hypothetical protein [Spirulinaceae cyanobacterium RM2_2_10]